jgi:cytoskeleton protein RodZ
MQILGGTGVLPDDPHAPMAEPAKSTRSRRRSAGKASDADIVALPDPDPDRTDEGTTDADIVPLADREAGATATAPESPNDESGSDGAGAAVEDAFADADPSARDRDRAVAFADPGGSDVARRLRGAREARGVSLPEAAAATCITASYLRALEDDEPVSVFPAPAYARFFAREYAQYLGLDGDDIVERFVEHHGIVDEATIADAPPDLSPRSRWTFRALGAISIAILVVLVAFAIGRSTSPGEPIMPLPSGAAGSAAGDGASTASGDSANAPQAPTREQSIRVELRMTAASWVSATADGEPVLSGRVVPAGRSPIFLRAKQSLSMRLGNPGGVRVFANGDRLPLHGDPANPVTVRLVLQHGKVVTRTL